MYIIVDIMTGTEVKDWNNGKRAEFINYDEAKAVLDTINRYTDAHYLIKEIKEKLPYWVRPYTES